MNRTTMILGVLLVVAVVASILWGTENGISPIRIFGNPAYEPFIELPLPANDGETGRK